MKIICSILKWCVFGLCFSTQVFAASNILQVETSPSVLFHTTLEPGENYFCDLGPVSFNLFQQLQTSAPNDTRWLKKYCRQAVHRLENRYVLQDSIGNWPQEIITYTKPIEIEVVRMKAARSVFQNPWGIQLQIVKTPNQALHIAHALLPTKLVKNSIRHKVLQFAKQIPGSLLIRRNLLTANLLKTAAEDTKFFKKFVNAQSVTDLLDARLRPRLGFHTTIKNSTTSERLTRKKAVEIVLASTKIEPLSASSQAINFRDPWFDENITSPILALTATKLSPISAAWLMYIASDCSGTFIAYDNKAAEYCNQTECHYFDGWGKARSIVAIVNKSASWQKQPTTTEIPEILLSALNDTQRKLVKNDDMLFKFTPLFIKSLKYSQNATHPSRSRQICNTSTDAANRQALFGAALLDPELLFSYSQSCTRESCSADRARAIFNTRIFSTSIAQNYVNGAISWSKGTSLLPLSLPEDILNTGICTCSSSTAYLSALIGYDMLFSKQPITSELTCVYGSTTTANHSWCWFKDGQTIVENGRFRHAEFGQYRSTAHNFNRVSPNELKLQQYLACSVTTNGPNCDTQIKSIKNLGPVVSKAITPSYSNYSQLYFGPELNHMHEILTKSSKNSEISFEFND